MADSVILRDEDVGRIGEYVKPWLRELVHQMAPRNELDDVSTQLLDRMVRVEEELKTHTELLKVHTEELRAQRELLGTQRELMDERFAFTKERFELIDKRFTTLTWMIGVGFVVITSLTTVFALLA